MLPKGERIKYSGLFEQAFQKGAFLRSDNVYISFTKTLEHLKDKLPLVGFSISKKFSKKATVRNKFKRRLREIYRHYREQEANQNKLKKIGLLVIAMKNLNKNDAQKNISELGYENLKQELESLLNSISVH